MYPSRSTGGSPPFDPDDNTPSNSNEPYLDWLDFVLAQDSVPQTVRQTVFVDVNAELDNFKKFSTSYGDDEQTVRRSGLTHLNLDTE